MKKIITLLLGLICCVGTASATDYYLGGTFTGSNTWSIYGQLTDEDNNGTYSIFVELPTGYNLYFTIFTKNSVDWTKNGETVLRPTSPDPWITNSVQTIELKGTTDTGAICYPTKDKGEANKNFARALKIDFTESSKTLSVTRFIVVASGYNGWSTTTDYISETTFGSKVYSGDVTLEAESENYDDGFKFVYLDNGTQRYGGKNGTSLSKDGSNATVGADGIYTLKAQFTDWNWQDPVRVEESITLTSAGLGTYASDYDLDFTNVTDLAAYKATISGSSMTFNKVNKVPAGEGVLLKETGETKGQTYEVPTTITSAWAADANNLKRGANEAVATNPSVGVWNYVLSGGDSGIGFYYANGVTVPTNRAYLQASTNSAKGFAIEYNDDVEQETDSINAVVNNTENGIVYNLAGQRVGNDYKGIVIVNGKKMLNK